MSSAFLFYWIIIMSGLIYIDYGFKKEFRNINKKLDEIRDK